LRDNLRTYKKAPPEPWPLRRRTTGKLTGNFSISRSDVQHGFIFRHLARGIYQKINDNKELTAIIASKIVHRPN
jgi:hypothetical protein